MMCKAKPNKSFQNTGNVKKKKNIMQTISKCANMHNVPIIPEITKCNTVTSCKQYRFKKKYLTKVFKFQNLLHCTNNQN